MKRVVSILTSTVIIISSISSCKKASTSAPIAAGIPTSQWTFNGVTDTGSSTVFATQGSTNLIESNDVISDSLTNFILLQFGSAPINNEKFSVGYKTSPDSGQCVIGVGYIDASHTVTLVGQGAGSTTDSVTVTIVNGKYHATFSNIVINQYNTFTGLSGALIQQ